MEKYCFKFKNIVYELTDMWEETCLNDSKDFQMEQFEYLIEVKDFVTMENRINNQIILGYIKKK